MPLRSAPRHSLLLRVLVCLAVVLALTFLAGASVFAQEGNPRRPDATPRMMRIPQLERPTLPARPSPAELGGQVYFDYCMTCHGDRGQGLTDEWRGVFDPQDQNCWQFRCHAQSHPAEGFELPRNIPPVVGSHMAAAFPTALALHDFIAARMPYQMPGQLSATDYWQVTAYLVRVNGVDPGPRPLDAGRAASLSLAPAPRASGSLWPALLALAVVLAGGIIFLARRRRATGSSRG